MVDNICRACRIRVPLERGFEPNQVKVRTKFVATDVMSWQSACANVASKISVHCVHVFCFDEFAPTFFNN